MDVRDLVRSHYSGGNLAEAIAAALAAGGVDVEHLTPQDLFPVDQLHAGGKAAADRVLAQLAPGPATRLLDVGCGIGGPSRLAATYDATVTGVDLTPDFVAAAMELTERVSLADRVRFVTTNGDALPFEPGDFNAAVMIHVGMNVPDKTALFADVHRVLEPGARFALYEQMRSGPGELPYPMPWAEDERSSFVESPEEYAAHLAAAGFTIELTDDMTESTLGPPPTGPLSPAVIFGQPFVTRIGNNVAATKGGLLGAVAIVARA